MKMLPNLSGRFQRLLTSFIGGRLLMNQMSHFLRNTMNEFGSLFIMD
ncbi:hypothetical protein ANRL1_02268 [Anaerolineae bacterium]|nr:hypothetical protein ANRL1_02268 [Anaerolineae bacterium]